MIEDRANQIASSHESDQAFGTGRWGVAAKLRLGIGLLILVVGFSGLVAYRYNQEIHGKLLQVVAVAAKEFEPFYSTKTFGVGLGLAMVKQIMEQHGGGVDVTSREERGTEVVLWLPLAAEAQRDVA